MASGRLRLQLLRLRRPAATSAARSRDPVASRATATQKPGFAKSGADSGDGSIRTKAWRHQTPSIVNAYAQATTTARLHQRGGLPLRMASYVFLPKLQELLGEFSVALFEFSVALPQLFGFLLHGRDPLFDRQKPGAEGVAHVVGRSEFGFGHRETPPRLLGAAYREEASEAARERRA